jgi:hypothetical protein
MKKLFIITFVTIILAVTHSTIRNVPGSYTTIQAAINASVNGDTVLVATGTYFQNINFRGRKIVVTSRYYLTNDPSIISSTIINGSTPAFPDTGSCVIFNNGEDSTAVLQGFSITGGTGTKWHDEHSSGVFREGGGILIQYSSPVIQNNNIFNNQVTNLTGVVSVGGGGMRIGDSYPRIYNNIVMNNTGKYGAGIVLNYSGCIMENNIICVNYGSSQYGAGSGIWINNDFARPRLIQNNTIVYNSATAGTGGINLYNGTESGTFKNNIVWGNTPTQISGTGLTISYCDFQGGIPGIGNINLDPQFSDTNYVLSINSPCVDAGDSGSVYNDPQDSLNIGFAKYPSRGTIRNDIGSYGGPLRSVLTSTPIGIKPVSNFVPDKFKLYQNYPNPFNPGTKIKFAVPAATSPLYERGVRGFVTLKIYDILGREVTTLVNEQMLPGIYEINWNANSYPSGVYFYKLSFGNLSLAKKMLMIK